MKKFFTTMAIFIGFFFHLFASTNIPAGNVSGTWTLAGSPYHIQGDITIPIGSTLTIEPGVTVNFNNTFTFTVNGRLQAIGTSSSKIIFTAYTSWRGLRIINGNTNGQDSTKLVHCNFYRGTGGTDGNGGAVFASASGDLLIRACMFQGCQAGSRGGAVYLANSTARIEKSLFMTNIASLYGGAIYTYGGTPVFSRLTFDGNNAATNGGSIYQSTTGGINLNNSILWNGSPQEIYVASGGLAAVSYCDIEGGYTGTGNINANPEFINPPSNYILSPCSPCVDSGSGTDPDGTVTDMGAFYFDHKPGSIINGGSVSGTWLASVSPYYVCGSVLVATGNTLTVQPGVKVYFTGSTGMEVQGRLVSVGNISNKIVYTAFDTLDYPSSWAGWAGISILNSNTNGQDSTLFVWSNVSYIYDGNITIDNSSDTRFENCKISRNHNVTGAICPVLSDILVKNCEICDNNVSGIYNGGGHPTIRNCTFSYNGNYALYSYPLCIVTDCIFENNFYPIALSANSVGFAQNNSFNSNIMNVFSVIGGLVTNDAYWPNPGIPYFISSDVSVYGQNGPDLKTTLELEPGITMKFSSECGLYIGQNGGLPGEFIAEGTESLPILFTGNTASPGYWDGIMFYSGSNNTDSRLVHCVVEYGGFSNYENIVCYSSDILVTNTISRYCSGPGLYASNASPTVTHCIFDDNGFGVMISQNCNAKVTHNLFINNNHGMLIDATLSDVSNNIFYNNNDVFSYNGAPNTIIRHNLFTGYTTLTSGSGTPPSGLGSISGYNVNGFPCDPYKNIITDPQFVNYSGGDYNLKPASPCINAGNPLDPFDADNTITDIGLYPYLLDGLPVITEVKDVPADQGKQVFVQWNRSPLDEIGAACTITDYSVWRQDEIKGQGENLIQMENAAEIIELYNSGKNLAGMNYSFADAGTSWTYITQLPALGIDNYSVVAPTLLDSVAGNLNESVFRVIAHTNYVLMYFASVEASGYSVDNLAPMSPLNLTANLVVTSVDLSWNPVPDEDFQYYAIYRSDNPGSFPAEPYLTSPDTGIKDPNPLQGTSYYMVTAFDFNGNESDQSNIAQVDFTPGIILDLKVFMEGPFMGNAMNTILNSMNYIPLSQPFMTNPWNYSGTEAVASIPNTEIVEWMLLDLRETTGGASTATSDKLIARKAVFVKTDGLVVAMDGSSMPVINITPSANLYVVLWHRNHLGIMTSGPVISSGNIYSWDFTSGSSQVYGGSVGFKQLTPGKWGMISGDGNRDFQVSSSDKIGIWKPQVGQSGYKAGDFNLNGAVDNVDKLNYWQPNSGKACQVPN